MTNWKQGYPEPKNWKDPYFWSKAVLVKTADGFILEGEVILDQHGNTKWYLRATDQIEDLKDIVAWMDIPEPKPAEGELSAFLKFANENYNIEIHDYIIQEWEKYHANRVEKLNESDFIEAGWKPNDLQSSDYLADFILNDYTIDIFDYGIKINKRHDTIFKGKIKNYNELLNLMKMLEIDSKYEA